MESKRSPAFAQMAVFVGSLVSEVCAAWTEQRDLADQMCVSPVFKGTAFLQTGGNLKTERIRGKYQNAVTENLEFLNKKDCIKWPESYIRKGGSYDARPQRR